MHLNKYMTRATLTKCELRISLLLAEFPFTQNHTINPSCFLLNENDANSISGASTFIAQISTSMYIAVNKISSHALPQLQKYTQGSGGKEAKMGRPNLNENTKFVCKLLSTTLVGTF